MDKMWERSVRLAAACAGAAVGLLGGWDVLLQVLMVLMAADYASGLAVALMGKSRKTAYGGLSSKVGAAGLARKGLMLLVVLVAAMVDRALGAGSAMCRDAACWFYIANEGLSILENLGLAGVPYPQRLKKLLGQKQEEGQQDTQEGDTQDGTDA